MPLTQVANTLILTVPLKQCNISPSKAHKYDSTTASICLELTNRTTLYIISKELNSRLSYNMNIIITELFYNLFFSEENYFCYSPYCGCLS
jgi:hypothetical protein